MTDKERWVLQQLFQIFNNLESRERLCEKGLLPNEEIMDIYDSKERKTARQNYTQMLTEALKKSDDLHECVEEHKVLLQEARL